jgi:hypothetical protein
MFHVKIPKSYGTTFHTTKIHGHPKDGTGTFFFFVFLFWQLILKDTLPIASTVSGAPLCHAKNKTSVTAQNLIAA